MGKNPITIEVLETLGAIDRRGSFAKEVATGWEPRISIAVESHQSYSVFLSELREFLEEHPTTETGDAYKYSSTDSTNLAI